MSTVETWIGLSEVVRNMALAAVAVIGLYAAWHRMQAATRQADASLRQQQTANDALLHETFTKAVDSLASDSLTIRVGGILTLGGLARAEPAYKEMAIAILSAYLEEHQAPEADETARRDIAAVATVLAELETD
ncbi:MAG: hypothetical protein KDC18_01465 [Alphaproteobacteria bacterium]|nr:hypothetical protein [Alphaproteobacteria bacterium]MCB9929784.1 hypothetical protein [Alphaproteobacteria bacterium]